MKSEDKKFSRGAYNNKNNSDLANNNNTNNNKTNKCYGQNLFLYIRTPLLLSPVPCPGPGPIEGFLSPLIIWPLKKKTKTELKARQDKTRQD